jgi:hypothetical protein
MSSKVNIDLGSQSSTNVFFFLIIYLILCLFLILFSLCCVGLDNPLVVSILDGNALRMFLEDEDDFAMIAENLFTDLDTEDKGKIGKSEIRNAVVHMGVDMGVPPLEGFLPLS